MQYLELDATGPDFEEIFGDSDAEQGLQTSVIRKNGQIMLSRDPWGFQTLFYRVKAGRLLVSPQLSLLSKDVTRESDTKAIAQYLMNDFSDFERTFYPSIHSVAPGQVVTFDGRVIQKSERKLPTANAVFEGDFTAAVDIWRKQLECSIVKKLSGFKKIGIFASGGLDSSGLLALIASLGKRGELSCDVEVYHVDFPDGAGFGEGIAEKLAADFGFPFFSYRPEQHLGDIGFNRDPLWKDLSFSPTFQFYEPLLIQASRNGCEAIIFGYGADEQMTPPMGYLSTLLAQCEFRQFAKEFTFLAKTGEPLGRLFGYSLKPFIPVWARQKFRRWRQSVDVPEPLRFQPLFRRIKIEMTENWERIPPKVKDFFRKEMWVRNLSWGGGQYHVFVHGLLCRKWAMASVCPYVDPKLFKIAMSLPLKHLLQKGQEKPLLRAALNGVLTDEVRLKGKFQDYAGFYSNWIEHEKHQLSFPHRMVQRGLVISSVWKKRMAEELNQDTIDTLAQIQFLENWLAFQDGEPDDEKNRES